MWRSLPWLSLTPQSPVVWHRRQAVCCRDREPWSLVTIDGDDAEASFEGLPDQLVGVLSLHGHLRSSLLLGDVERLGTGRKAY